MTTAQILKAVKDNQELLGILKRTFEIGEGEYHLNHLHESIEIQNELDWKEAWDNNVCDDNDNYEQIVPDNFWNE